MKNNFEIRLINETDTQAVLDIYKYFAARLFPLDDIRHSINPLGHNLIILL